ncbi:DUF1775 domain-containing protein [Streptomyces microflavus]|uniref:DUF1775 domain-containing protein n=1 Tax=Streptomyces TaxID=1883 RepID=UPI0009C4E650|nr:MULTISPECIES: DUF1775 domain-containing protein [Streptomyces]MDX2977352.1 DUF1775 domain-containing protein [Streptomyces sp. NRRL_B-2249]ONI49970.1 hypothetical protein STIB_56840 [Streptomyces sp. IB2014 011-1]GGX79345.1 hypothetical protein GCM10010298_50880 [Streptomyces microflavus]
MLQIPPRWFYGTVRCHRFFSLTEEPIMFSSPFVARRISAAGALVLAALFVSAAPALAHVEVQSETPQALVQNVSLTFEAEAESDSAGITEMRVVLPDGIAPTDVVLLGQPKGWKLTADTDGFTVGGPPVAVGTNAVFTVKVRQLPDADELAFKTIETYSDGKISRWIEIPKGDARPQQPAPVLELKAAAPGASPIATSPSASDAPAPSPTSASPAVPAPEAAAKDDEGEGRTGLLVAAVAIAVLAAAGGVWWLLKRRSGTSQS